MPNHSTSRPKTTLSSSRRPQRSRRRTASSTSHHTSLPTSRTAYCETRQWLLERHGPVCAYCERRIDAQAITLDHVTPRRGQTAYDRRDNLVLACPDCNARKADQSILAFLLARRARAASLLRFGDHLSPMLVDLARQIAGPEEVARVARLADPDYPYRD
jgi:5-methylcytosine-specific restriction endonuclease McrA